MSESSTFVAAVLEDLQRGVSLPVLDEPGASSKLTLPVGTYDLYILERFAAGLLISREDLASRLLVGALTDAARHSLAIEFLDDDDADDYIYAVEVIRALQSELATLRRNWKTLAQVNRPTFSVDGSTATLRALEPARLAGEERLQAMLAKMRDQEKAEPGEED